MIKVGIIGSGFGVYGLLPAFSRVKNCQVVSLCAQENPRTLSACKKYKVKKLYSSWEEMLEKEKLDAVAIAVIPEIQYQIAKAALKKGLHVFAEKPLAANLKQAQELNKLAKQKKVVTAVDFIFPQISEWLKAKQLLEKKSLGKLTKIESTWDFLSYDLRNKLKGWKTSNKSGGGATAYYFSHVLYYLEYFAGTIIKLKSFKKKSPLSLSGGEVGVKINFQTNHGVEGEAEVDISHKGQVVHKVTLTCENGKIILENNQDVVKGFKLKVLQNGKLREINVKKVNLKGLDERVGAISNNALRFVTGVMQHKQITPSFKEGLRVQELISQINEQTKKH